MCIACHLLAMFCSATVVYVKVWNTPAGVPSVTSLWTRRTIYFQISCVCQACLLYNRDLHRYWSEWKCADRVGTVAVHWAGHFQCYYINVFFKWNIQKQFYHSARKLLWFKITNCWLQFKKKNYSVIYYNFQHMFVLYCLSYFTINQSWNV